MDRDAIKRELRDQFEQSLDQAIDAVAKAPDGRWIAASEWQIREIFQKLMQQSYQTLLQKKLDANNNNGAAINENPCTFFSGFNEDVFMTNDLN